jgi:hypothetical protein
LPVFAQFAGPALLTRGEAPAAMGVPQVDFRPYVEVTGVYDTGLTGVVVTNPQGDLANAAADGVEIAGGLSGLHSWRHTKIGVDYRGSVRHYARKTYYDGVDQSLMLSVTHQFSRHTTLSLRESGGQFTRDFGLLGLSQTVPYDPARSYIPTTDFFDNRTVYLTTQADFTLQKSARLSFNLGGDGFLARRRSTALYGVTGSSARADTQYRLTRRSTIGVAYSYTHFEFTGVFSGTDLHTVVGSYAIRLTRSLEFTGYGGFLRAETKLLQNLPVDPAITALLGITVGAQVIYHVNYLPNLEGRFSRTFQHGVAFISGGHTVNPGNGLFLTSSATSLTGGYTYTGLRRWSFNANAGYSSAESLGNITGRYSSASGGFTGSRQLSHLIHGVASITARQYDSSSFSRYHRLIYEARLGFGFSPGDVPLRVW